MEVYTVIDYIPLNGIEIESSGNETLGVILDNDLKFDAHIKSLCRKATQRLSPSFLSKQIFARAPKCQFCCEISIYLLFSDLDILFNSP